MSFSVSFFMLVLAIPLHKHNKASLPIKQSLTTVMLVILLSSGFQVPVRSKYFITGSSLYSCFHDFKTQINSHLKEPSNLIISPWLFTLILHIKVNKIIPHSCLKQFMFQEKVYTQLNATSLSKTYLSRIKLCLHWQGVVIFTGIPTACFIFPTKVRISMS